MANNYEIERWIDANREMLISLVRGLAGAAPQAVVLRADAGAEAIADATEIPEDR